MHNVGGYTVDPVTAALTGIALVTLQLPELENLGILIVRILFGITSVLHLLVPCPSYSASEVVPAHYKNLQVKRILFSISFV